MTRSEAREIAVRCSYAMGYSRQSPEEFLSDSVSRDTFLRWKEEDGLYRDYPNEKQLAYIREVVKGVASHGPELDQYIARYAQNWSFDRIPRTAAAIMRVSMYEILYMDDIPAAASINDAVEIAKKYEDEKVVSFINGILGTFVRTEFPETGEKPAPPRED
jgi:N utilization substance protein B